MLFLLLCAWAITDSSSVNPFMRLFYLIFFSALSILCLFMIGYCVIINNEVIIVKCFSIKLQSIDVDDIVSVNLRGAFEIRLLMKCGERRVIYGTPELKAAIRDFADHLGCIDE